jgi:hypothetical protein
MNKSILTVTLISMFVATAALAECTKKTECATKCETTPLNCAVEQAQAMYEKDDVLLVQGSMETNSLLLSYHELDSFYGTIGHKTEDDNLFVYGLGKSFQVDESVSLYAGATFGTYENGDFVGGLDVGILIHADNNFAFSMGWSELVEGNVGLGVRW